MSYTTTTVSRRQFAAKAKPGQRQAARPPPVFRDNDRAAAKAAVPELFNRFSSRRVAVPVPATPWWKTWLVVTLSNVVALAVLAGIYAWSQSPGSSDSRRYTASPAVASRPASVVNIRPMGLSSSRPSTYAPARQGGVGAADSGTPSGDPVAVEQALSDGSRKLVLPANVAGDCSIGDSGSKDFGRCLVQNGARAE